MQSALQVTTAIRDLNAVHEIESDVFRCRAYWFSKNTLTFGVQPDRELTSGSSSAYITSFHSSHIHVCGLFANCETSSMKAYGLTMCHLSRSRSRFRSAVVLCICCAYTVFVSTGNWCLDWSGSHMYSL